MKELITINNVNTAVPTFTNKRLNDATQKILSIYVSAANYADRKNREIAKILASVAADKCYAEDGFDSVSDYAEKTFGIRRTNAYALATAGAIYNDVAADERLKELSPSKLAEISRLAPETTKALLDSGRITPMTTQKELREIAAANKPEPKPVVMKMYHVYTNHIGLGTAYNSAGPATMTEWDERFTAAMDKGAMWSDSLYLRKRACGPEYPDLPCKVYFSDVDAATVFFFEVKPEKKSSKAATLTATKEETTTPAEQ